MGKVDTYTIPLKSLAEGIYTYTYHLDDAFFKEIDATEVQRGKVDVALTIKREGETFELHFTLKGHIIIPCDRCLDDMELPIATEDTLYIKFGETYSEESEELLIVPETEGTFNPAWYMYECIALTIPLQHMHPEGMCNAEMESLLKAHSASLSDEETEQGNHPTDPRWDVLKKLRENENK